MEGPVRALRTSEYLLVHNLFPDRWPAGTSTTSAAPPAAPGSATATTAPPSSSSGSTGRRKRSAFTRPLLGEAPEFELYDLRTDPMQVQNLAATRPRADLTASRRSWPPPSSTPPTPALPATAPSSRGTATSAAAAGWPYR